MADLIDAARSQRRDDRVVISQRRGRREVVEDASLRHPQAVREGVGVCVDLPLLKEASRRWPEASPLFKGIGGKGRC